MSSLVMVVDEALDVPVSSPNGSVSKPIVSSASNESCGMDVFGFAPDALLFPDVFAPVGAVTTEALPTGSLPLNLPPIGGGTLPDVLVVGDEGSEPPLVAKPVVSPIFADGPFIASGGTMRLT